MCWKVSKTELNIKKVAEKDIPVFKICNMNNKTKKIKGYFYSKRYTINKVYSEEIELNSTADSYYTIKKGLHCYYSQECSVTKHRYNLFVGEFTNVFAVNYHLYTIGTYDNLNRSSGYLGEDPRYTLVKLDCIIPKGALYYINSFGEIVTTKLKVYKATILN